MVRRLLSALLLPCLAACTAQPAPAPAPGRVRVETFRDTRVSAYRGERERNGGWAPRLKLKGTQELSLLDFDPVPWRGRTVRAATLHVRLAGDERLRRVSVSTLASPWTEGHGRGYDRERGAATFAMARQDVEPWAWPGSTLPAAALGGGHTRWRFADATPPDDDGWQAIALDPRVVAARIAGLSHGLVLMDDVGCEWERVGDRIDWRYFPNRYVWSREAGPPRAPWFEFEEGPRDDAPPGPVGDLAAGDGARVAWTVPADEGPAGTLGFDVRWTPDDTFSWDTAHVLPLWRIPPAGAPGSRVAVPLRDLAFDGTRLRVGVRAVDAAGNRGPVSVVEVTLPRPPPVEPLVAEPADPGRPLRLGARTVAIGDALDTDPSIDGAGGPLGADGVVALRAARGETVAFQVRLSGGGPDARVGLRLDGAGAAIAFGRIATVPTARGPLPDPVLPLDPPAVVPAGDAPTVLLVEVHVSRDAPAGGHDGALRLSAGVHELIVPVSLRVWRFTLPDVLSFVPQMNCYGLPSPPAETAWYRLAHRHRTCLNRLPYGWRGRVRDGCAPEEGAGGSWDWTAWDARFGPLLDGSAFAGLPRAGTPVDHFYLPVHENWPVPIDDGYRGGYWAEEALAPGYRAAFVERVRRFGAHLHARGWRDTVFEFYLNGKAYHKRRGWHVCSAPWVFDEPLDTKDFWALRWYAQAFHEAVAPFRAADPPTRLAFRADISQPEWQRDLLDGLLDVPVIGSAFPQARRLVVQRARRDRQRLFWYGTTNAVAASNQLPVAWSIEAWARGADGIVPWQTVGTDESWTRDDELALLYPGGPAGVEGPVASLRLKAYRRGQQDVEYLALLAQATGVTRRRLGAAVLEHLALAGESVRRDREDAGRVAYAALDSRAFAALRAEIGERLDRLAPPPAARPPAPVFPPRPSPAFRTDDAFLPIPDGG